MTTAIWTLALLIMNEDNAEEAEDNEDLDLLYSNRSTTTNWEYSHRKFHLDDWSDDKIIEFLRFSRSDIQLLVERFNLAEGLEFQKRYAKDPEFGLVLVLYRLSYPCRLKDMQDKFGMHRTSISVIFNDTLIYINERYKSILTWHPLITREQIRGYADTLSNFGTQGVIWGFLNGTFGSFCRPQETQRSWYSGYKKSHGQKFHAICTPDGMTLMLDGPYHGPVNDVSMVHQSQLEARLEGLCHDKGPQRPDQRLFLYGDQAYRSFTYIMAPYSDADDDKAYFNMQMSAIRISVENVFGRNHQLWQQNSYKYNLRSGLMPVGAYYEVAAFLTNCHTCLYGNQISERFGHDPPTLDEYLSSPHIESDH